MTQGNQDKEYLPITGLPEFTKVAAKLAYGVDSTPLKQDAVSRYLYWAHWAFLTTYFRSLSPNLYQALVPCELVVPS